MPLNTPAQVSAATLLESYAGISFCNLCDAIDGTNRLASIFEQILEKKDDFEAALEQTPTWLLELERKHDGHFLCDSSKSERLMTAIFLEVIYFQGALACSTIIDQWTILKRGLSIRLGMYFEFKLHQKLLPYSNPREHIPLYALQLEELEAMSECFLNKKITSVFKKFEYHHETKALKSEIPVIFFEMLVDVLNYKLNKEMYPCYLHTMLANNPEKRSGIPEIQSQSLDESRKWQTLSNHLNVRNNPYFILRLLIALKINLTSIPKDSKKSEYKHDQAPKVFFHMKFLLNQLKNQDEISCFLTFTINSYISDNPRYMENDPILDKLLSILDKHLTKEAIINYLKNHHLFVLNLNNLIKEKIHKESSIYYKVNPFIIVLSRLVEKLIEHSSHQDQFTEDDIVEMHLACIELIQFTTDFANSLSETMAYFDQARRFQSLSIHNKLRIIGYALHQTSNNMRSLIIKRALPFDEIECVDLPSTEKTTSYLKPNVIEKVTISDDHQLMITDETTLSVEKNNGDISSHHIIIRSPLNEDPSFERNYYQSEEIISTLFSNYFPLSNANDFECQFQKLNAIDQDHETFLELDASLCKLSDGYRRGILPLRAIGALYLVNKREKLLAKEAKLESLTDRLLHYKATFGELSESPRKNLLQYERMDRSSIFSNDHLQTHGLALTEIILKNDLTTVTFSLRLKSLADRDEGSLEIPSALLDAIKSIADHDQVLHCSFDNNIVHIKVDPELRIGFLDESFSGLIKINDVLSEPLTDADYLALSTLQDNDTSASGFDESHIRSILMTYFERADLWEKTHLEYPVTLTEVLAALKNEYEAGKPTKKHLRYDIRLIRGEYETHATCLIIDHEKKSIHYFDSLADNNDTLSAHDLPSSFDDYSLTFNSTKTQEDDFGCFAQVAHHIICTLHPDEALSPAERQERAQLGTDSVKLMNHYWRYVKLHQTMALDNKRAYTYLLNGLRQVYGQVKADAGLIIEEDSSESSALKLQQSGYLRAQLYSLILGIQNELADSASLATSIPLVFLAVFIRDNPDNLLARYIHLALRNTKSPLSQLMLALSLSVLPPNTDALIEVLNKLIAKMNKVKVGLIHHETSYWRSNLQAAFQDCGYPVSDLCLYDSEPSDIQEYDLLAIPGTTPALQKQFVKTKQQYIILAKIAYQEKIPMFGECFGHQTLYATLTGTPAVAIKQNHPEQASTHLNPRNTYGNVHEITYDESSYFMHYQDFQSPTTTASREAQTHEVLTDSSHSYCISADAAILEQQIIHVDAMTGDVPEAFTSTSTVGNTTHALVLGTQFHPSNKTAVANACLPEQGEPRSPALVEESQAFHQWILLERLETAKFCRFFKKKEKSIARSEALTQKKHQNK